MIPKKGELWQGEHSGRTYEIIGIAQHSQTYEKLVCYVSIQPRQAENYICCPLSEWDADIVGQYGSVSKRFIRVAWERRDVLHIKSLVGKDRRIF